MANAILLHGRPSEDEYYEMDFPSPSNAHWFPWLQQKFLRNKTLCQAPEMPTPYNPSFAEWSKTYAQFEINEKTIIVAHSMGCGFNLKYLDQNNFKINSLILVAPWLDPEKDHGDFLEFHLDQNIEKIANSIHILNSTNDMKTVLDSVGTIRKVIPSAHYHEFENKGHFCLSDLDSPEFPELWNICKSI